MTTCTITSLETNISDKQSGYRRNDSTVKQLLSITHKIYKAFDDGHEIRVVFLDISRTFDRVWHEGIIFKLKQMDVEGDALNILTSFLANRNQRVVLDGQTSDWGDIEAGSPARLHPRTSSISRVY